MFGTKFANINFKPSYVKGGTMRTRRLKARGNNVFIIIQGGKNEKI